MGGQELLNYCGMFVWGLLVMLNTVVNWDRNVSVWGGIGVFTSWYIYTLFCIMVVESRDKTGG